MASLYRVYNGPAPTTAALVPVTTGTAIKTMLQVKLGTQNPGKVTAWGISFDGSAAGTPIKCELIETGAIFATVTASLAADIVKQGDPNSADPTLSNFVVSTTATGYTATAEGSITTSRLLDYELVAPSNQYVLQFPLGREPQINVTTSLRVRVTAAVAVNAVCWIEIEI